ncbi:MAG: hypothetical protein ACK478_08075 [Flavobacteriales bacterium]|jgi:hypothetical protein
MGKMKKALASCLLTLMMTCCFAAMLHSQVRLSPADSLQLHQLRTLCALDELQRPAIDSLFTRCAMECTAIDKELSRVSRSAISEEERTAAQSDLRAKKKAARDNRDFAAQFLLTPQQRITYNEKIKPAPPAILHMGMNHDRANCNVCVTK